MKKTIVALALLGSSFAHADIKQVEARFKACADQAETTAAHNECAAEAYKTADLELNKFYNSTKKNLQKETDADHKEILSRLISAQKAWLTFRDANCSLAATQMLGGTGEFMIVVTCLATSTIDRVKELQNIFETL